MCGSRPPVPDPERRARGVPEAAVGAWWCVSAAASRACNGGVAIAGAPRPTCMTWRACTGRVVHGTRTPYMECGRHVSRGPPWGVWSPWGFHPTGPSRVNGCRLRSIPSPTHPRRGEATGMSRPRATQPEGTGVCNRARPTLCYSSATTADPSLTHTRCRSQIGGPVCVGAHAIQPQGGYR